MLSVKTRTRGQRFSETGVAKRQHSTILRPRGRMRTHRAHERTEGWRPRLITQRELSFL
jgi:hypothetical protein